MEPLLGQIQLFPYGFAPAGWLPCEGQVLNIQSDTALFALVGTKFGGNGISVFHLPDLREKSPDPGLTYCIAISGVFPSRN